MFLPDGNPLDEAVMYDIIDPTLNTCRCWNRPRLELNVFSIQDMIDLMNVCSEAMKLGSQNHIYCSEVQFFKLHSVLAQFKQLLQYKSGHEENITRVENKFELD